jgi:hypothetical protein
MLHHPDHEALQGVLTELGAKEPRDVRLETFIGQINAGLTYRAFSGTRSIYIDRPLAVRLRENGAVWCGELLRDPCAVA